MPSMMIGKDKLVFDPSVSPLSENDNMGAFTRSGLSGAQITNHSAIEAFTGSFNFVDGDVSTGSDTITEVAHGWNTGDIVQLSNTGGALPAGLAAATNYYVIRVDADTIKLAASWADAEAGIAIDITAAAGGGTHTATRQDREFKALDVWIANSSIEVTQGTSPWVIGDGGGSITVDGTVTANQGTSPWIVQAGAEKAEDAAHSSGDTGNFILAVRHDADTSLVDADGDYAPLQVDANGNLKVVADLDVDFDYIYAEDSAHTSGDLGSYVLAVRQDTLAASTDADGDYASFKLNSRGGLWTVPVGTAADDAADSESPVKVGWRAYDGPLAAVAAGDRVNAASDLYRRLYVNNGSNIALLHSQEDVDNSGAIALPVAALPGRRSIMIQNLSNKEIYVGSSGVTSADGWVVAARGAISFELGPNVSLYAIGSQASAQDIRILEMA